MRKAFSAAENARIFTGSRGVFAGDAVFLSEGLGKGTGGDDDGQGRAAVKRSIANGLSLINI